ncbi:MAG TPA: hypothetical protein VKM55_11115 [Candidatus Lokiarchaeia archaeon]|nr:hypothetical protein [Candidatus Lokiarchaeia archaeon]
MSETKYRSNNVIIQTILECILRAEKYGSYSRKGIVKSQLIKYCALKATTADKYLKKMESAGYIISHVEPWGEREIILYESTPKGKERYEWFVKINAELKE